MTRALTFWSPVRLISKPSTGWWSTVGIHSIRLLLSGYRLGSRSSSTTILRTSWENLGARLVARFSW